MPVTTNAEQCLTLPPIRNEMWVEARFGHR
jgi:hypothetical protein